MCLRLDSKGLFIHDWRMLAERLDCPRDHIRYLEHGLSPDRSPSDELLEWWECQVSERIPLAKLVKILRHLDREDAAEVIAGLCETTV